VIFPGRADSYSSAAISFAPNRPTEAGASEEAVVVSSLCMIMLSGNGTNRYLFTLLYTYVQMHNVIRPNSSLAITFAIYVNEKHLTSHSTQLTWL